MVFICRTISLRVIYLSVVLQNAFQIAYFLWTWVSNTYNRHVYFRNINFRGLKLEYFIVFNDVFKLQYEFKITSCFHENLPLILTRVFLGIALQVVCSYITFPLYSLVTQVTNFKRTTKLLNETLISSYLCVNFSFWLLY